MVFFLIPINLLFRSNETKVDQPQGCAEVRGYVKFEGDLWLYYIC